MLSFGQDIYANFGFAQIELSFFTNRLPVLLTGGLLPARAAGG